VSCPASDCKLPVQRVLSLWTLMCHVVHFIVIASLLASRDPL